MPSSPCSDTRRSTLILVSGALLLVAVVSSAAASEWTGRIEVRDGVEQVLNPAHAVASPLEVSAQELWRIGGASEAEEEFFGVISQIATDTDGNVYLLDRQLSEVRVFSPGGAYLRTLGREGEGPGEFRQALDMFFLPDGNLGILQLAPGRIVMLSKDGDPLGDHPLPELENGETPVLVSGHGFGENLLLVFSANKLQEGKVDITRTLALIDKDGVETKRLLESTRPLEFVNFLFDEKVWRTFDNRWRVGRNDYLYSPVAFLPYEITVWDSQGNRQRVIHREYDHWNRTKDQKQEMYDIFDALLQNQLPEYTIEVSDHDPAITNLYPRDDGTLWVLTSQGTRNHPDGALGVFDVFDADGHFHRQVTLIGEGDPMQDGYFIEGERLFVVTDLLEADIASRGGRQGEVDAEEEEPEPITVICYDLAPVTAAVFE